MYRNPEYRKFVDWDLKFLGLADHISTWSHDPSTKTGSVIVNSDKHIISVGYNGFPRGMDGWDNLYDIREEKLKYICHADRNALDNAYSSVKGCTQYITHPPCNECQKSIIQKGIARVVFWKPSKEFVERWGDGVYSSVFSKLSIMIKIKSYDRENPTGSDILYNDKYSDNFISGFYDGRIINKDESKGE